MVGIEIAGGSAKLGRHGHRLQFVQLLGEPIDKHHHLFSQPCGRGGLAVSLGQHGHVGPLVGISLKLGNEFLNLRDEHIGQGFFDRKRNRSIVDILRGKPKVDELLVGFKIAHFIELFLDKVFYGLDIMIGDFLYVFHPLGIGLREQTIDVAQLIEARNIKSLQLRQGQFAKSNEIFNLYPNAIAD